MHREKNFALRVFPEEVPVSGDEKALPGRKSLPQNSSNLRSNSGIREHQ